MQRIDRLSTPPQTLHDARPAAAIPKVGHDEAAALATVELSRFLELLDTLRGDDWQQPTACTLWRVKDIVAHQAGSLGGWTGIRSVYDHHLGPATKPYVAQGMSMLDAINQADVDRRADHTPAALIAEIRDVGPRAITFRKRLPLPFRLLPIPDPDFRQYTIGYLTDIVLVRDMWMHRLDICRATGHDFVQTADHDGRVVALVVRDLADVLRPVLGQQAVVYTLTGVSGGSWRFGGGSAPAATLTMDVLDFNNLASRRLQPEDVQAQGLVTIDGDAALAAQVLAHTEVLY